jgi:hypothetical protein
MAGHAEGDIVTLNVPGSLEPLQAVVMGQAAIVEKEPNNEFGKANAIAAGAPVAGRLEEGDAEDHFVIEAKKGDRLRARVFAQALGSPLDAVLTVSDAQGNQVYESDDADDGDDPNGVWKVAADGKYDVRIKDRFGKNGAEYAYVLCVKPVTPDFKVTIADAKPVTVKAGKNAQIKLKVELRDGFAEPLQCRLANLPLGLVAKDAAVPAKSGEFQLTLEASPDAPPFQGPVWISVWPQKANTFKTASYDLRGDTKRGSSLLDSAEALWLTVQ